MSRPRGTCSVLMTCFNEGAYIGAAVRSVLDQTAASRIEKIVVMDDGSDAATLAVLEEIAGWDPRIEIDYGRGRGLPLNRNLASEKCRSEYLAILDGDDIWLPEKLERQLAVLDAAPGVGLVYTGFYTFFDQDLQGARASRVIDLGGRADLPLAYFLNDPPIIPSTVALRREPFEAVGRFDPAIKVFEDTDFYLRLAAVAAFAAIDRPLIYKRNRNASITGQKKALMAHHAYVAFKFAAAEPRALPHVPRRLAERARKLGNVLYYQGEIAQAAGMYELAVRLNPANAGAVAGWLLSRIGGRPLRRILNPFLQRRAAAFGP